LQRSGFNEGRDVTAIFRMNNTTILLAVISIAGLSSRELASAQNGGDQFLDGIGETALVARYLLNGSERDSGRNANHAALRGSGASYVTDGKFGQVLALPGGHGVYVQIPGLMLDGLDTVSVSGWIYVRSGVAGPIFDFGASPGSHFFFGSGGSIANENYRAGITRDGSVGAHALTIASLPTNRWQHLALVLDATHQTFSAYVNCTKAGQAKGVTLTLEQVLNQENGNLNRAFLGRAQDENAPCLNALLHDFRIYSVALTEAQVGAIYTNAWSGGATAATGNTGESVREPAISAGIAQPFASQLIGVKDVAVETRVGYLPKLPGRIPGVYRGELNGPLVRVVWPAPTNNQATLTAGVYTVAGKVPGTDLPAKATVTVRTSVPVALPKRQLEPFPLGAVTLLPDEHHHNTQFIENRDKFIRELAETNPDRFLYMFRNAFGQPQPEGAEPLDGWDSQTTKLRGHATGHYLSALAQAYASTSYDEAVHAKLRQKLDYMVAALYQLSRMSGSPTNEGAPFNADPTTVPPGPGKSGYESDLSAAGIRSDYWNWGQGFISAYPPDQFIMLERGAFYGGGSNQIWAPYYTLHKILAGLLDCYEVGGNEKALTVAKDMARWVQQRLEAVPVATRISMWNRYIAGEYGGMNEVLARLGRISGDTNYLEGAKLFDNVNFFFGDAQHTHGLARNVDTLRGKHANQHLPQIIGALETYRDTHEPDYWFVAENFWDICTDSYMYSIGGVAGARKPNNAECFTAQPDSLFAEGFSKGGQNETCATYNLLKLSRQMFLYDPDAKYMDYYERALYNHILASVAERDAGNTYHVPLNPGARKQFGNARMDGFTCCNGTALESNTKLQDSIYFRSADDQTLYVNLYVPSQLNWPARKVIITQQTDFPHGDTTKLLINSGGTFEIKVRVPGWVTQGFSVKLNGRDLRLTAEPGTYLSLGRAWKDGDNIELQMPFTFHLLPVMDQPNIASLFYGPVLLAAEESGPRSAWRPITLKSDDLGKSLSGDPHQLRFKAGDAAFKPFYETYGRHSVYLDVTLE